MPLTLLTKLFGSRNDRLLKQYRKTVARINALEPQFEKLSDEQISAKTQEFKERLGKGETLDQLLPEAFAVVREASKRVMKMRHSMTGAMVMKMPSKSLATSKTVIRKYSCTFPFQKGFFCFRRKFPLGHRAIGKGAFGAACFAHPGLFGSAGRWSRICGGNTCVMAARGSLWSGAGQAG